MIRTQDVVVVVVVVVVVHDIVMWLLSPVQYDRFISQKKKKEQDKYQMRKKRKGKIDHTQ